MLVHVEANSHRMVLTYPRTRHYVVIGITASLLISFLALIATTPHKPLPHLPGLPGEPYIYWLKGGVIPLFLLWFLLRSLWQLRSDNTYTLDRTRGELWQGTRVVAFLNDVEGIEIHRVRNGRRDRFLESYTYLLRFKLNNGRHLPVASSANSISLGGGEQEVRDLAREIAGYLNVAILDENAPQRAGLFF